MGGSVTYKLLEMKLLFSHITMEYEIISRVHYWDIIHEISPSRKQCLVSVEELGCILHQRRIENRGENVVAILLREEKLRPKLTVFWDVASPKFVLLYHQNFIASTKALLQQQHKRLNLPMKKQ